MSSNSATQQEVLERAESELKLHINKRLYEQGIITEEIYKIVAQGIVEDLINP